MCRVIFYYQTMKTPEQQLISLDSILYPGTPVRHLHLAALHFGTDSNHRPYLHLNNRVPTDSYFDEVWQSLQRAVNRKIKLVVMIGGAGGGYASLFSDFDTYYPLLVNFLQSRPYLSGVDLDVEETCNLSQVKMLINRLVTDFGPNFSPRII